MFQTTLDDSCMTFLPPTNADEVYCCCCGFTRLPLTKRRTQRCTRSWRRRWLPLRRSCCRRCRRAPAPQSAARAPAQVHCSACLDFWPSARMEPVLALLLRCISLHHPQPSVYPLATILSPAASGACACLNGQLVGCSTLQGLKLASSCTCPTQAENMWLQELHSAMATLSGLQGCGRGCRRTCRARPWWMVRRCWPSYAAARCGRSRSCCTQRCAVEF